MGSSLRHAGSSLRRTGFSLVVACGFFLPSCGTWAPECMGPVVCGMQALSLRRTSSVVVARRLSCPVACGILVPRPGIEPASLALEGGFSTTGPPAKSQEYFFCISQALLLCLLAAGVVEKSKAILDPHV